MQTMQENIWVSTDRLLCCGVRDSPDCLLSPFLPQLLVILWKGNIWNSYVVVRKQCEVAIRSRA